MGRIFWPPKMEKVLVGSPVLRVTIILSVPRRISPSCTVGKNDEKGPGIDLWLILYMLTSLWRWKTDFINSHAMFSLLSSAYELPTFIFAESAA